MLVPLRNGVGDYNAYNRSNATYGDMQVAKAFVGAEAIMQD